MILLIDNYDSFPTTFINWWEVLIRISGWKEMIL